MYGNVSFYVWPVGYLSTQLVNIRGGWNHAWNGDTWPVSRTGVAGGSGPTSTLAMTNAVQGRRFESIDTSRNRLRLCIQGATAKLIVINKISMHSRLFLHFLVL